MAAIDTLLASQFRRLFELPVVRCHSSAKLIGSLLCRQLVTVRTYELWFTFANHALRFLLDEFRDGTCLNCGAFDVQDSEIGPINESEPGPIWKSLFDTAVGDITVGNVLGMLRNRYPGEDKRLPLALIALVDGALCCSNKQLKLTPRYVEILSNVESFLAYPWGRESFLVTLPCFLPTPANELIKDPLAAMRDQLSQKTTVCYGFPLALQLFAFEAVSLLLEKIPAANTTNFLDEPRACTGGDRSFCPKLEAADAGQGEKGSPFPVHRRNLRPRKAVPVEVEEVSSSTNSEEGDPPCSGRCTHEMLKRWMKVRFEKLENKGLGMPEVSNHNTRKRKARDPQRRQNSSPDSIGIETHGPNWKGIKRKTVANSAGEKKTLSRRGSGGETGVAMVGTRSNNTASSHRESGRQNKSGNGVTTPVFGNASLQETRTPSRPGDELSPPDAQQSDNAGSPPPGENKVDQQVTEPHALVPYGPVLDVEPESYVLPPKIPSTKRYEVGSPVPYHIKRYEVGSQSHGRKQTLPVIGRLALCVLFTLHGMETPPPNLRLHPPELKSVCS
ncbi:Uncharacterized protein Rs2_35713 [Raphanus sativus]|nr:Uncharacterized protein Rs2_35713 [Raphanus sativus]